MKHLLFIILVIAHPVYADNIKPFTTDGCSIFPDGKIKNNAQWMTCCIKHDYAYWKGGLESEREKADADLKQCVSALGEKDIASLMHLGVRLGGEPLYPTWYRWGYGWPYTRGYQALTAQEQQQVRSRLLELRELVDIFIKEVP